MYPDIMHIVYRYISMNPYFIHTHRPHLLLNSA